MLENIPAFGDIQDPTDPTSQVAEVTNTAPWGGQSYREKPSYKLNSLLANNIRNDQSEASAFIGDQFRIEYTKMAEGILQQFKDETQSVQDVLRTPPPKPVKAQASREQLLAAAIGTLIAPNNASDIAAHTMGRAQQDADRLTEQQLNEWKASQNNAMRELKTAEDIRNFRLETQSHLLDQEFKLQLDSIATNRQEERIAKDAVAEAFKTGNWAQYQFAMTTLSKTMTPDQIQAMDEAFNAKVKEIESAVERDKTRENLQNKKLEGDIAIRNRAAGAKYIKDMGGIPWKDVPPEKQQQMMDDAQLTYGVSPTEFQAIYEKAQTEFQGKQEAQTAKLLDMQKRTQGMLDNWSNLKTIREGQLAVAQRNAATGEKNATTARINALKVPTADEEKAKKAAIGEINSQQALLKTEILQNDLLNTIAGQYGWGNDNAKIAGITKMHKDVGLGIFRQHGGAELGKLVELYQANQATLSEKLGVTSGGSSGGGTTSGGTRKVGEERLNKNGYWYTWDGTQWTNPHKK